MQRNLDMKVTLDGTKRIDEVFNLTLTLPTKVELNVFENCEYIEREFELTSGIMAEVSNSMYVGRKKPPPLHGDHILEIRRDTRLSNHPMMCLHVKLSPKPTEVVGMANDSVTLSFVDLKDRTTALMSRILANSEYDNFPSRNDYLGYEFMPDPWPEQACLAVFSIPIYYRKLPALQDEKTVELKDEQLLGKLDPKDFFTSETFSDVIVECRGEEFPAHRIILAGNSPVFKAMLSLPTKEAENSRIVDKDTDVDVFEGLLRFMYTGQIEPDLLEMKGEGLYCAADKYNVQDLILICEAHLLKNVNVDNALVMYDLAQRRPESSLAKKSCEIIARNKESIAADVDSFKNFTNKYPALIFDIFKR